jgi:hypothetical protein
MDADPEEDLYDILRLAHTFLTPTAVTNWCNNELKEEQIVITDLATVGLSPSLKQQSMHV